MFYANRELKYMKCDFCGHEKECYVQREYDDEQVICPGCLLMSDYD
ncbi:MAG: hypothetical protein H6Q68_3693 [Firmicutes bacterium]|nr:hypothetical protein [Bacillota bacterium]